MKVLLINGSPRGEMCTKTALSVICEELTKENIESEIIDIGNKPVAGCISCGYCKKNPDGFCVFKKDKVNECIEKMKSCDALIVGSPVHYASTSGAISSFMDRLSVAGGKYLTYKPGAAVASCRRGGASATLDRLNKYFQILNMPIIPSNYWNMVHGNTPEEVLQDEEGIQTLRILGKNTAWLLKLIENGKKNGINHPEEENKIKTNFIR